MKKIHIIVGARPNIIKASPVYNSLKSLNKYDITVVNTGQHYDKIMMDTFIDELDFKAPDINLKVGSGSHGSQTAKIITKYEEVLINDKCSDCFWRCKLDISLYYCCKKINDRYYTY